MSYRMQPQEVQKTIYNMLKLEVWVFPFVHLVYSSELLDSDSKIPAHQPLWPDWNATKKDAMLSRLFKAKTLKWSKTFLAMPNPSNKNREPERWLRFKKLVVSRSDGRVMPLTVEDLNKNTLAGSGGETFGQGAKCLELRWPQWGFLRFWA